MTQNEQSLQKPTQFVRRRRSVFDPSNERETILATVGIVRDNAQTAQLDRSKRHMSGNPMGLSASPEEERPYDQH